MNSGGGSRCAGVSSSSRPGDSSVESVYFDPSVIYSLYIDALLVMPGCLDPDPDFDADHLCTLNVSTFFKYSKYQIALQRKALEEKRTNGRHPEK